MFGDKKNGFLFRTFQIKTDYNRYVQKFYFIPKHVRISANDIHQSLWTYANISRYSGFYPLIKYLNIPRIRSIWI